jgi:hypothetical protein
MKEAVLHASCVLDNEGIGYARVVKGDAPEDQHQAVRRFNESGDMECSVFLLHAGQAAAGTLMTKIDICLLILI